MKCGIRIETCIISDARQGLVFCSPALKAGTCWQYVQELLGHKSSPRK